ACAPTDLLGRWVREKRVLSLEEGVRRLTSEPAEVFGIADRGRLAVGLAADLTVFDPATVGCGPLRRVRDFPAGADRLVLDARGVRAVVATAKRVACIDTCRANYRAGSKAAAEGVRCGALEATGARTGTGEFDGRAACGKAAACRSGRRSRGRGGRRGAAARGAAAGP